MEKTLERAIAKAAALPEAAQEQLGREMIERIGTLAELRATVEAGQREQAVGWVERQATPTSPALQKMGFAPLNPSYACSGVGRCGRRHVPAS